MKHPNFAGHKLQFQRGVKANNARQSKRRAPSACEALRIGRMRAVGQLKQHAARVVDFHVLGKDAGVRLRRFVETVFQHPVAFLAGIQLFAGIARRSLGHIAAEDIAAFHRADRERNAVRQEEDDVQIVRRLLHEQTACERIFSMPFLKVMFAVRRRIDRLNLSNSSQYAGTDNVPCQLGRLRHAQRKGHLHRGFMHRLKILQNLLALFVDEHRLFKEHRDVCLRRKAHHLRVQVAAGADHDAVQVLFRAKHFLGRRIEPSRFDRYVIGFHEALAVFRVRICNGRYLHILAKP